MTIITDATCWKAVPTGEEAYHVVDILVDLPGGGHVASVTGFEVYGQVCAATCAHANLIAAAPLLLHMLQQARAALPDAWFAVRSGVPRELIEAIDAAISTATASSLPPTPSATS
jgi:hypothetical protein